jgi:hypothetical protein
LLLVHCDNKPDLLAVTAAGPDIEFHTRHQRGFSAEISVLGERLANQRRSLAANFRKRNKLYDAEIGWPVAL